MLNMRGTAQTVLPSLYVQPTEDGFQTYVHGCGSLPISDKKTALIIRGKMRDKTRAIVRRR